ncbi:MAG: hypothetical protein IJQ84_02210 [Paludibacteraceae bacterium]|nr:hypothetical protein [Paludibacteraceae bacterium]
MKSQRRKSNHCKIDPILYDFYLALNNRIGATIVHRRKRPSSTCIEIIILNESIDTYTGRLNTLKEAESCGFWVISRVQKGKHAVWHGHRVFQLFLSPVHPKKQREQQLQAASTNVQQPQITAQDVTFEPIFEKKRHRTCIYAKKIVPLRQISDIYEKDHLSIPNTRASVIRIRADGN